MRKILFLVLMSFLIALSFARAEDIKSIVIDPGHGGYDFGIKIGDLKEKELALSIARELEVGLRKHKDRVFLTRASDSYLSIDKRALLAGRCLPDVFVSLHAGKSGSFTVYVSLYPDASLSIKERYLLQFGQKQYIDKSKALSKAIGKAIKDEFELDDVFLREMPLPLLNSVSAPAVLIEVPLSYAGSSARIANVIAHGISLYERQ